jgi:predicted kinase
VAVVLIVLAGLPGTGKSTIAAALGRRLRTPVLTVDLVERALDRPPDMSGYVIVNRLADQQLRLGLTVIVDAVNPVEAARAGWRVLAADHGVPVRFVEVTCSDVDTHRDRVEARRRADPAYADLDWPAVERRIAEYEAWPAGEPHVALDTAGLTPAQVTTLVDRVIT